MSKVNFEKVFEELKVLQDNVASKSQHMYEKMKDEIRGLNYRLTIAAMKDENTEYELGVLERENKEQKSKLEVLEAEKKTLEAEKRP